MGNHSMMKSDTLQDSDYVVYRTDSRHQVTFLTNKFSQKQYILRAIPLLDPYLEQSVKKRKTIHHHHVTPLIQYRYGGDYKNIYLLFEVRFKTLEELRMETAFLKKYLKQQELLSIIYQIVQGLKHLKINGIHHGSIKGSNFSIDNNNRVKVVDPLAKTLMNNYERVKANPKNFPKQIYLSPHEFNSIKNNETIQNQNNSASDIFSLGMVMLELGIAKTLEDVYSLIEGVRIVVLINHLHEFEKRYSYGTTKIVKSLLHFQEDTRIELENLEKLIEEVMEGKIKQNSDSSKNETEDMFGRKEQQPLKEGKTQVQKQRKLLNVQHINKHKSPKDVSKSRSPSDFKKRMLVQQTSALSAAIKKKINNLLQVSENIKTYQYSSSQQKNKNNNNAHQESRQKKKISGNQKSNMFQPSIKHQIDKKNKLESIRYYQKPVLNNLNEVQLNDSITIDSPKKQNQKNASISNVFEEFNKNRNQELNISFIPGQKEKCMIQSTVEYGLKDFQQHFQSKMTNTKSDNKTAEETPRITFHTQSNQNNFLSPFNYKNNNYTNIKSKYLKNRSFRHQSGDIERVNEFHELYVDLNNSSNFVSSNYQFANQTLDHLFPPSNQFNKHQLKKQLHIQNYQKKDSLKLNKYNIYRQIIQQARNQTNLTKKSRNTPNIYEGETMRGAKHGRGRYVFDDLAVYQGEWSFNKMHGTGKLYYSSGFLAYEGQWFRDKMQGFGVLNNQYPTHTKQVNYKNFNIQSNAWLRYQGTFKNDIKHGNGLLTFSSSQSYQGQFDNGVIHGEGVFKGEDTVIQGKWQCGQLVKIY